MKKVLILFVVVLMCLSSFAGITPAEVTPDSTNITFLTDENIFGELPPAKAGGSSQVRV